MTSVQAIINILKEQVAGYRDLLALLQKERDCLVDINAEMVEEISKEKDTTLMRLRLLEEERIRLTRKFAEDNGIAGNISLKEMETLTGDITLPALRSQLLSLIQSIEEMNRFNRILIERSLKYIRTTTNFLSLFASEQAHKTTGTILSKET